MGNTGKYKISNRPDGLLVDLSSSGRAYMLEVDHIRYRY